MVFCADHSGTPVPVIQKDERTLPDIISCQAIPSLWLGVSAVYAFSLGDLDNFKSDWYS